MKGRGWLLLVGALLVGATFIPSLSRGGEPAKKAQLKPGPDAGSQRTAPASTDDDREVVENLELLQSLDEAGDLDLLMELSQPGED